MKNYIHKDNLDPSNIVVDPTSGSIKALGTILFMNGRLNNTVDGANPSTVVANVPNGTYKDSNDNSILVIGGKYIILERPRKRIYRQFDKVDRSITTTVQTLTWFTPVMVRGNLRIEVKLPTRADTEGWGGLYCTPILIINGVKYDLGNEGYGGGVMTYNGRSIDEHTDEILINIADVDPILASTNIEYELGVELQVKSFSSTTYINRSHDINRNLISNDGTVLVSAQNQNWSTITVEEIDNEVILG